MTQTQLIALTDRGGAIVSSVGLELDGWPVGLLVGLSVGLLVTGASDPDVQMSFKTQGLLNGKKNILQQPSAVSLRYAVLNLSQLEG